MRAIKAVGYDMDYTLIHYHVEEWERQAYETLKKKLLADGWPVGNLQFEPVMVCRGLIIDTETGNLIKANRFGFVKKALHGTSALSFEKQRDVYQRTIVDLSESRWVFLNTLFSLSEGCMYAQLVDLLDRRELPGVMGYLELYRKVRSGLNDAHMEGELKAQIVADPERFVDLDPEIPLALLDQKNSGKKLLLITNSEWGYTSSMMTYAFDRYLPEGMTWQRLFDLVIVGARKPAFFTDESPFFEVVTQEGLLRPLTGKLSTTGVFLGGSAQELERHLSLSGDEILYIGDHMYGDVHVTKRLLRWRTGLILRELEDELRAIVDFQKQERELESLMQQKELLETELCGIRIQLQRKKSGYGPESATAEAALQDQAATLRQNLQALDQHVAPLAKASGEMGNSVWGLLMRAGNDKSHLARQMERHADIYTSRVSNLLYATPFVYLRSSRGSLPHDPLYAPERSGE
ncbi:MAG: HAD family hydrolase [Bdellovibrionales bacterium GWC1_52_8]|nr:MAG: HAD family hydrolase [Bdellovibrionales bacterium GWA1_52_35]OFZ32803.1 MAG: HAD family hydrolase [Bdellovibrionales bacterium GWC1_52_8]